MQLVPILPDQDIVNCVNGNTPHSTNININKVLHDLEKELNTLFKWFTKNLRKSHIFLRTQQEKFKLILEWPSPTVNVKNFWVS